MTFEEMKKQFLIMEGNLTAHRETNKKLYDENIKLKANLKECYTESENEINMWRDELDKLKAKNNELLVKFGNLMKEYDRQAKGNKQLKYNYDELKAENKRLKREVRKLTGFLTISEAKTELLGQMYTQAEATIKDFREALEFMVNDGWDRHYQLGRMSADGIKCFDVWYNKANGVLAKHPNNPSNDPLNDPSKRSE